MLHAPAFQVGRACDYNAALRRRRFRRGSEEPHRLLVSRGPVTAAERNHNPVLIQCESFPKLGETALAHSENPARERCPG